MSGVAIITVSNNVLLIVVLFLLLFNNAADSVHRSMAWTGGLVGIVAVGVLALFIVGALAQSSVPIVVAPAQTFADQIIPIAVAVSAAIGIIMAALLPAIAAIRKMLAEQAGTITKLEVNTNSISEKLREAIEVGALAKGNLAGRAELQAEQDAEDLAVQKSRPVSEPVQVEVSNPEPVKVQETKT